MHRRDFLRVAAAAGAAAGVMSWTDAICLSADDLRKRGMACILLWMGGGPSQFETFSPKPGHENGGETKAISTSVSGIQIAESLPKVRRRDGRPGDHPLDDEQGRQPSAGQLPAAPRLLADGRREVSHARLARRPANRRPGRSTCRASCGSAAATPIWAAPAFWASTTIRSCCRIPKRQPENTQPATRDERYARRLEMLEQVEADFGAVEGADIVADHQQADPQVVRDDSQPADGGVRPEQGVGQDARRLRPHASSAPAACWPGGWSKRASRSSKSTQDGWDTHDDNFNRVASSNATIDQPMAQLITDLQQRGMLERTLVIWMGEFGRTPRINARAGRDHYPRAFNVALAGGGIRGGQVIGETDAGGVEVTDRPVTVSDLFRTIYTTLGIDADHENMSRIGRPIKLVDGGEVVRELLG